MKTNFSSSISKIQNWLLARRAANISMVAFLPGVFFLALGVAAILAPSVLVAIVSAVFLYLGALSLYLGWKFIQIKRRVEDVIRQVGPQIQVVAFPRANEDPVEVFEQEVKVEGKKVTLH